MTCSLYINGAVCISAQDSLQDTFFDNLTAIEDQSHIKAKDPVYKDYIPSSQIRRMSQVVKMSNVAAQFALKAAAVSMPDAIIVGTGMGCIQDSEKFLKNVIDNDEEFLTPTFFIQSTHNTVAGQIALGLGCHAYNFTYVNPASSLEFSLLDAGTQLATNPHRNILVGAADEMSKRTLELFQLNNTIISDLDLPTSILNKKTKGVVWGEGASFFVVAADANEYSSAKVSGIDICNEVSVKETSSFILHFLEEHKLQVGDIDGLMLGINGSLAFDDYYTEAMALFPEANTLYWKHLSGEFNTSMGFAIFMTSQILKRQSIPEVMQIKPVSHNSPKRILIYNQLHGQDHSLVLMEKV